MKQKKWAAWLCAVLLAVLLCAVCVPRWQHDVRENGREAIRNAVLHSAVVNYLANQRQGTQSTKTRTEVSGGGLKMIIKQLGSAGTGDPLDQRATVGWKSIKTAVRLVEEYMIRVMSVSSFNDAAAN